MMALLAVPAMGLTGAAVDYSRANAVRAAMQSALDSAGLILSKEATGLNGAELEQKASSLFNAVFTRPDVHDLQLTQQVTSPQQGSFILQLTASAKVPATFTKILGTSEIGVRATSEVVWGIKKLNLALVLDNTGSMASNGKMTALKSAAHDLLTTLQAAAKTPGDVKVSIVPFATDVNIGTDNVNETWIRWTEWEAANGTCSNTYYKNQANCTQAGKTWTPAPHSAWNGCVMDRDQNSDIQNTAATSDSTRFPAHQASACPVAMMPLSHDWTALNAKIDAMTPTGNTNTTIGLALGWQTLTPAAPYNAPEPAPDLDKVIVLLTDGENTQNRWTSSSSSINARTEKTCENIKAANIRIYTVRVINGNEALLKKCATNASMYYDVDEASQLNNVFSAIAQNLANLRLAK